MIIRTSTAIGLTRDKIALVDDADFATINQHKWYAEKIGRRWYAARRRWIPGGKGKSQKIYMHQDILGPRPEGKEVDHKDRDGLNNQRSNLRWATRTQNNANRARRASRCGYQGVYPDGNRFLAKISDGKRQVYLGCFKTPEDAARAYDAAATKIHGEFATVNFAVAVS